VASNRNAVLTLLGFLGFLKLFSTTRCNKSLKLYGNVFCSVVPNLCMLQPFTRTFRDICTWSISVRDIATTKKQSDLCAICMVEVLALERGKKYVKKVI